MGSKAINQFPQVTDQDATDRMYLVRPDGSGDYDDFSIDRALIGYTILSRTITITSAQLLALNATPQLLVSGVIDKIIIPQFVTLTMTGGSVNYATNTTLTVGSSTTISDTVYTLTGSFPLLIATRTSLFPVTAPSSTIITSLEVGEDLYVRAKTGNPTAGNGDITFRTYYMLVDA